MKIYDMKVNHRANPIGISAKEVKFSFKAVGGSVFTLRIYELGKMKPIYTRQVNFESISQIYVTNIFTRGQIYIWDVECEGYKSNQAQFETALPLSNRFITPLDGTKVSVFELKFKVASIKKARLYVTGLGLYRCELNKQKVGENYLTPYFNDYDDYVRYQTYDITDNIQEDNTLAISVGDGWYKGRFGIDGHAGNTYGGQYLLSARLVLEDQKGAITEILTDPNWSCYESSIIETSIYDGEVRDDRMVEKLDIGVKLVETDYRLEPDDYAPVVEKLTLQPELIHTPKGEKVLDFGQNMVGLCRFVNRSESGTKVVLTHGEVLQDGNFYNDNYRTAKAQYTYISDGLERIIEPYFTFYGFRYIKVEGLQQLDVKDFEGVVLYSDLESTLKVESSNDKINQLMSNALWSQRGNFLDLPTDCPQRDERLGWTADAQVFVNTACFNMDCLNFYKKYMADLRYDQTTYYDGNIPMYSPSLKKDSGVGGAVWGDAATIIPWHVYKAYGDVRILQDAYPMMRDYVTCLIEEDEHNNNVHLISGGFTFGDWLAMDGICDQSLKGGTEDTYIKSIYYMHSLNILGQAAKILNKDDDATRYQTLCNRVRNAIIEEYFSRSGRLSIDTQTAYVLALKYEIHVSKAKLIEGFKERLKKDLYKIKSGFTGTPLFLPVMFENHMVEEAYRILFNEDLPGWLYAVNLGATTIWERWNSIKPNGEISGIHMNSLNHYAYGSVCEAIYEHIAGLKVSEPGWRKVIIEPKLNHQLKSMSIAYESPCGMYSVKWNVDRFNKIKLDIEVPFGGQARVVLPYHPESQVEVIEVGNYSFSYTLTKDMCHPLSKESLLLDLLKNDNASSLMQAYLPQAYAMVSGENKEFLVMQLHELAYVDMFGVGYDQLKKLDKKLREIVC